MSILVATDFSDASTTAIAFARWLSKMLEVPLVVAHVFVEPGRESGWAIAPGARARHLDNAERYLKKFATPHLGGGSQTDMVVLEGPRIVQALVDEAQVREAQYIVVGTSGRSQSEQIFFGSTASNLVRSSDVPVITVPGGFFPQESGDLLVPVDLSDCSRITLTLAGTLAQALGVGLRLVHAIPLPRSLYSEDITLPDEAEQQERSSARRGEIEALVEELGLGERVQGIAIEHEEPEPAIRNAVTRLQASLMVLGTHGHQGYTQYFLGSTTERILRSPPCVLITLGNGR